MEIDFDKDILKINGELKGRRGYGDMTVKYFINGIEYKKLNDEQRKKITEKLEKSFGLTRVKKGNSS